MRQRFLTHAAVWQIGLLLIPAMALAQSPGSRVDRTPGETRASGSAVARSNSMARQSVMSRASAASHTTTVSRSTVVHTSGSPERSVPSRTAVSVPSRPSPQFAEYIEQRPGGPVRRAPSSYRTAEHRVRVYEDAEPPGGEPMHDELFPGDMVHDGGYGCESCGGGCGSCGDGDPCGIGGCFGPLFGWGGFGCGSCRPCCSRGCSILENVQLTNAIDGFKGPIDLDGLNGNFGIRNGANIALPLYAPLGVGIQGGINGILSDFHGSLFSGVRARTQIFVTVGVFQRAMDNRLHWGFAYDWLNDDYYVRFHMGQWRVKLGWQPNPYNEFGVWAAIGENTDNFVLGVPPSVNRFKPISQGNVYWQHEWHSSIATTGYIGWAEFPGDFVFGASTEAPLSQRLSLTSNFTYLLPSASGGSPGYSEECWNLSCGVAFYPGRSAFRAVRNCFRPIMPVADNGSFLIQRR